MVQQRPSTPIVPWVDKNKVLDSVTVKDILGYGTDIWRNSMRFAKNLPGIQCSNAVQMVCTDLKPLDWGILESFLGNNCFVSTWKKHATLIFKYSHVLHSQSPGKPFCFLCIVKGSIDWTPFPVLWRELIIQTSLPIFPSLYCEENWLFRLPCQYFTVKGRK